MQEVCNGGGGLRDQGLLLIQWASSTPGIEVAGFFKKCSTQR